MRSKRIRRQIQEDPGRWLLSYADFITLLFAFFVVMYAMSSVNVQKYKQMASSFGYVFDAKNKSSHSMVQQKMIQEKIKNSSELQHNTKVKPDPDMAFETLNSTLQTLDNDMFDVKSYDGWYEIEIKSSALFDSGQADLSKAAIDELKRLAFKLKDVEGVITVEGYTDIIPIHNNRFGSNWALSAARAAMVAQIIDSEGLTSKQISAVGYASQFPVATNRTAAGREKNRRVVIVVAKDANSQRLFNPLKSKPVITQEAKPRKANTITIKKVKEIKTESGGLIFTQSIEDKEMPEEKAKPQTQSKEATQ